MFLGKQSRATNGSDVATPRLSMSKLIALHVQGGQSVAHAHIKSIKQTKFREFRFRVSENRKLFYVALDLIKSRLISRSLGLSLSSSHLKLIA